MKKSFGKHYSLRQDSFNESCYNLPHQFVGTVESEFEGRLSNKSVVQTDNPATRYKGLLASQFCLENQNKIGATADPVLLIPSIEDITSSISNVKLPKPSSNVNRQEISVSEA